MNWERVVRKIRNGGKLFAEDDATADKASRVLGKAKTRMLKLRVSREEKRGPYSGLTRDELARTGTVETDWY